jgi:hypothetical protein
MTPFDEWDVLELWTDPDHPDPVLDAAYRSGIGPAALRGADDGWDSFTVLHAKGRRLAKLIARDGTITDYDAAKHFDLSEIKVDGLDHLEDDLQRLLHQPNCGIVRGQIIGRSRGVRRLLHPDEADPPTLAEVPRHWLALDVDGLPRPSNVAIRDLVACAGIAVAALPPEFHDARSIVQATAGHGYKPGLRLRLWYWLDHPLGGAELKRWLAAAPVDHALFSAAQTSPVGAEAGAAWFARCCRMTAAPIGAAPRTRGTTRPGGEGSKFQKGWPATGLGRKQEKSAQFGSAVMTICPSKIGTNRAAITAHNPGLTGPNLALSGGFVR